MNKLKANPVKAKVTAAPLGTNQFLATIQINVSNIYSIVLNSLGPSSRSTQWHGMARASGAVALGAKFQKKKQ